MTEATLILASASPRRMEILDQLGIPYVARPQDIDESRLDSEDPADYVCRLARVKAEAALAEAGEENTVSLGSDTTVVCGDEIFEKPVDEEDAVRILSALSGKTHQVLTAVALATSEQTQVLLSESNVTFRLLSKNEIRAYWSSGEPSDKAGGYGIQGLGAVLVEKMEGSYSGIMGLPVRETVTLLEKTGLTMERILGGRQ
jgi:septum formation protein